MIRPDSLNNQLKLLFGTNKLFLFIFIFIKKSYQKTDISYLNSLIRYKCQKTFPNEIKDIPRARAIFQQIKYGHNMHKIAIHLVWNYTILINRFLYSFLKILIFIFWFFSSSQNIIYECKLPNVKVFKFMRKQISEYSFIYFE